VRVQQAGFSRLPVAALTTVQHPDDNHRQPTAASGCMTAGAAMLACTNTE
jgi:hypothetical protein